MIPAWLPDTLTTDPDRMVSRALLWGMDALELRTVGGPGDRVPFVNEAVLRRRMQKSELGVAAVDPGLFEGAVTDRASWMNDLSLLDETLAFCRRIGCGRIVASSFHWDDHGRHQDAAVEVLRRAGDRAARAGVKLVLIQGSDSQGGTGVSLATLLAAIDHDAVRGAWDPVRSSGAGEAPKSGLDALGPYVEFVRYREQTSSGFAWPSLFAELVRIGYSGPVSMELASGTSATAGLSQATAMVKGIESAKRGEGR